MSLKSFSQIDTIVKPVILTKPVARLVIKDLVSGDAATKEIKAMQTILTVTNDKFLAQSDLVANLKKQNINLESIIGKKDDQFRTQKELSDELQKALKKANRQKKLYQIGSVIGAAAILLNVIGN